MWKTLIGYICFEECIDQIEKKRNFIIKKRLIHQELINKQRNMDEYCFYKEQIKNILYEYCNDVFEEERNDIFFDLTKSQYVFGMDSIKLMKCIQQRIADELCISIHIGFSFHQEFAKWIYMHSYESYRILSFYQAVKIFGKNICSQKRDEMSQIHRTVHTLPQSFGQDNQDTFLNAREALIIAQNLSFNLVKQLKEKDYGVRCIQIQFYDIQLNFYKKEEKLRNYTNIHSEIMYVIERLLNEFSYQGQYFGLRIVLCDFKDFQDESYILPNKVDLHHVKRKIFGQHNHLPLKNCSLFEKTV